MLLDRGELTTIGTTAQRADVANPVVGARANSRNVASKGESSDDELHFEMNDLLSNELDFLRNGNTVRN